MELVQYKLLSWSWIWGAYGRAASALVGGLHWVHKLSQRLGDRAFTFCRSKGGAREEMNEPDKRERHEGGEEEATTLDAPIVVARRSDNVGDEYQSAPECESSRIMTSRQEIRSNNGVGDSLLQENSPTTSYADLALSDRARLELSEDDEGPPPPFDAERMLRLRSEGDRAEGKRHVRKVELIGVADSPDVIFEDEELHVDRKMGVKSAALERGLAEEMHDDVSMESSQLADASVVPLTGEQPTPMHIPEEGEEAEDYIERGYGRNIDGPTICAGPRVSVSPYDDTSLSVESSQLADASMRPLSGRSSSTQHIAQAYVVDDPPEVYAEPVEPPLPWWKRRRVWIVILLIVVLTVGAIPGYLLILLLIMCCC